MTRVDHFFKNITLITLLLWLQYTTTNATTNPTNSNHQSKNNNTPEPNPNNSPYLHPNDNIPITQLSVPLFSSHLSHHAYVYIGSPPQRRLVIVDTGSGILSFPCEPCEQCGTRHVSGDYWNPAVSSTDVGTDCHEGCVHSGVWKSCRNNQCIFQQAFSEGSSLTAYEISDLTWIGTDNTYQSIGLHMHTAVPFTFGCLLSERGMIADQFADGILGLALHSENLLTVMYREGSIGSNSFGLCLSRVDGGFLSIGGVLTEEYCHLKEPMRFEPLAVSGDGPNNRYYTVRIIAVRISSIVLSVPRVIELFSAGKGTIIDSGTSDSYLPAAIAGVFQEGWIKEGLVSGRPQGSPGGEHNNRVEMYTYEQFKKLPKVVLTLSGGYDWEIEPAAYMEVVESKPSMPARETVVDDFVVGWDGEKKLTNRIYLDEPSGCVLGANAMLGHNILFDMAEKRIGIAKANCKYHAGRVA